MKSFTCSIWIQLNVNALRVDVMDSECAINAGIDRVTRDIVCLDGACLETEVSWLDQPVLAYTVIVVLEAINCANMRIAIAPTYKGITVSTEFYF